MKRGTNDTPFRPKREGNIRPWRGCPSQQTRATDVDLKIATYNVNGVNARLPRLLEWLAQTSPDIACLQELRTEDSKLPVRAIQDAGYGAIWHGQRSHHGVAVLAKGGTPIEIRRGLPGDAADTISGTLKRRREV